MRFAFLALLLATTSAAAQTEIHRCVQEDGSIAFSQLPCTERQAEPEPDDIASDSDDDEALDYSDDDFASPFDEAEVVEVQVEVEASLPEPVSQDRAECEKITRDAIDAVDLEMRSSDYTAEEGGEYLARLRELTQKLRACKQL